MGIYAECTIDVDWIADKKKEFMPKIEEAMNEQEIYARWEDDGDTLFISSGRQQHLEHQLEQLTEIFKKYKESIIEIGGSVMSETGDGIYYNSEDGE